MFRIISHSTISTENYKYKMLYTYNIMLEIINKKLDKNNIKLEIINVILED